MQHSVFVEEILLFFLPLSSGAVLSTVRLEVTIPAQAGKVVRVQSHSRISDVAGCEVLNVVHLLGRLAALHAQEAVTHQDEIPD